MPDRDEAPDQLARRTLAALEESAAASRELTAELRAFRKALSAVLEQAAKAQGAGLLGSVLGKVLGGR